MEWKEREGNCRNLLRGIFKTLVGQTAEEYHGTSVMIAGTKKLLPIMIQYLLLPYFIGEIAKCSDTLECYSAHSYATSLFIRQLTSEILLLIHSNMS